MSLLIAVLAFMLGKDLDHVEASPQNLLGQFVGTNSLVLGTVCFIGFAFFDIHLDNITA